MLTLSVSATELAWAAHWGAVFDAEDLAAFAQDQTAIAALHSNHTYDNQSSDTKAPLCPVRLTEEIAGGLRAPIGSTAQFGSAQMKSMALEAIHGAFGHRAPAANLRLSEDPAENCAAILTQQLLVKVMGRD